MMLNLYLPVWMWVFFLRMWVCQIKLKSACGRHVAHFIKSMSLVLVSTQSHPALVSVLTKFGWSRMQHYCTLVTQLNI